MDVGAKIKAARLSKNLTQAQLGEVLGVQKSAIARYESGKIINIKREVLKKIADTLDIPPFELIYEPGMEEMQKKNNTLADIVQKLRFDDELFAMVETLAALDVSDRATVKAVLSAFSKAGK